MFGRTFHNAVWSQADRPVATPHVSLFDSERKLRYCGRIDHDENSARSKTHDACNALDTMLAGKPVPVETTRTFGCSVIWSGKRETDGE